MEVKIGKISEIPGDKFPLTKIKNVSCICCKHCFNVKDLSHLRGQKIPFVLKCGHPICHGCLESNQYKSCPVCKRLLPINGQRISVNVYVLGLIYAANKRSVQTPEPDISFQQSLNLRPRQLRYQGQCHECGIQAAVKCPQCNVLYCSTCYAKMHGRALQHHQKILLTDIKSHVMTISNVCSKTCNELPGYFCNICNVTCCSHCMLHSHQNHSFVKLKDKNAELMPEFSIAYDKVAECFQRVHQAQKKLRTVSTFPAELQNSEAVEKAISQHFAYLHGVLQNAEKRLIGEIHEQRDRHSRKLDEMSAQLREQEDQLHAALHMAASAQDCSDNVDIQEMIRKLEEVSDLPCHLVQEPVSKDDKIDFLIDKTIVEAIENHCTMRVPAISCLALKPTSLLPQDYEIEPLTQEIKIPKPLKKSPAPPAKPVAPTVSAISPKPEPVSGMLAQGAGMCVRVTHVVDPLCFFVQSMHKLPDLNQLNNRLAQYESDTILRPPTEVTLNKLYVVLRKKDKQWCRARITKINTDTAKQKKYKVFYVDDGTEDHNVSVKYMRNVTAEISAQPALAMKCSLHDIVPRGGKWKREAIKAFCDIVNPHDQGPLNISVTMQVAIVRANTYYVDLLVLRPDDKRGPLSLRDTLIVKEYASFHSWDKLMRINPQSMQLYYTEKLELEKYAYVDVQHTVSPEEIYVTKTGNVSYVRKQMKEMAEHYGANTEDEEMIFVPQRNMPCAVEDADGIWQRAIISEINPYGGVRVFLVDVGSSLTRKTNMLRMLPQKFMVIPTQAIKISLRNLQPPSADCGHWTRLTIDYLKKNLSDKMNVKIFPFEKTNTSYSCQLYLKDDIEISKMLISSSLAQNTGSESKRYFSSSLPSLPAVPDRAEHNKSVQVHKNIRHSQEGFPDSSYTSLSSMDAPSASKENPDPFKIRVHIHQIISPVCIYVSEVAREQSNAEMVLSMQNFYNKYRSKEQVAWEEGAVYAAYSAKDKSYFRARIKALRSAKEAVVFFYDLGIEEVVNLKDIQTLHTKFLQIPAYLFKVKLAGILPCGGKSSWPSLSCERLREIVNENQNCKFYISKAEDSNDEAIPVELWVKQSKTDGPLLPTKVEINCINRMLVENGVALPIKGYAQKKDKILAIDLKRELNENSTLTDTEIGVTWCSIDAFDTTDLASSNERMEELDCDASSFDLTKSEIGISEYIERRRISDFSWKPAEPIIEDEFEAMPTYVDHDCAVYIHSIKQNGNTLHLLESKLDEYYRNYKLKTCDMTWQEGDICIAQYHYNKKWYRAKVVKVLSNNKVQVEFVDYGNVEDCEIGTLLKRVILHNVPIQCTKCIIHGLHPDTPDRKWRTGDLDVIHAALVDKQCKVTVVAREPTNLVVSINLFQPIRCDLITYLVNEMRMNLKFCIDDSTDTNTQTEEKFPISPDVLIEKYVTRNANENDEDESEALSCSDLSLDAEEYDNAIISNSSAQIQSHNMDDSDTTSTTDFDDLSWTDLPGMPKLVSSTPLNESMENFSSPYTPLKIPDDEDILQVEICFILRPNMYYIQLREDDQTTTFGKIRKHYCLMMLDIQDSAETQPLLKTLTPNTPCCAKYRDDLWYRCLIKECITNPKNGQLKIKLSYVDFGNKEVLQIKRNAHNLRVLKDEWLTVPTMAIKCWLWNVDILCDTNRWSVLLKKLSKICGPSLTAKVKEIQGNILWVDLFTDQNCTNLAYASLIEAGLLGIKTVCD